MNHLKRFPHYRQHNASDCGPTSLRMVAKFYGMDYSAEMLRKHCHISRRGVSMLGIIIFRKFGSKEVKDV